MGTTIIDPDMGAGYDYDSVYDWEAGQQGVLSAPEIGLLASGNTQYDGSGWADGEVVISGWTASATNYIELKSDSDSAKYNFTARANEDIIDVGESHTKISGINGTLSDTYAEQGIAFTYSPDLADNFWQVSDCIFNGVGSTGSSKKAIYFGGIYGTLIASVWDILIKDVLGTLSTGIYINDSDITCNIYNTAIENCTIGVDENAGTATLYNSILANCATEYDITNGSLNYCLTDSGDGNNPQTPIGGSWTNEFTDLAGEDYTLKSGGNAIGNGVTDPSSGLYSDDILGNAWSAPWDIGPYKYVGGSPPGISIPVVQHHRRRH